MTTRKNTGEVATTGSDSTEEVRISPRTGKPIEKKYAPKTKRKPRGGNSPVIGDNGYNLKAGDNAKFMGVQMALFNMPDIDMEDNEAVQQRLNDFFELYTANDMKPTVAGMALALNGMGRQTLRAIATDGATGGSGYKTALPLDVATSIKKAYKIMESLWETYMSGGKVNPVAGIFLGKNNYGYQDKTEYVLTPNQKQDGDYDAQDIKERYLPVKALEDKSKDSD